MSEILKGGVAVIEREKQHFLIKQSSMKPFPNTFRHPGGFFEEFEEDVSGIEREIREETGYEIEVIDLKPVHIGEIDYPGVSGFFGFFRAIVIGGELKIEEREIEACGWFTLKEIANLDLMPATKIFYEIIYPEIKFVE